MSNESQTRPQSRPGTGGGRGQSPSPPETQGTQKPPGQGRMPFDKRLYWLLLAALTLWNLWLFVPRPKLSVTLPYSEFIAQLQSGNVAKVRIAGASISGQFAQPVLWPPPQPPSSQANAPTANAAAHGPQRGSKSV
jgi:hypothetical protein